MTWTPTPEAIAADAKKADDANWDYWRTGYHDVLDFAARTCDASKTDADKIAYMVACLQAYEDQMRKEPQ